MWSLQQSCQELKQQMDSFVGSWRGQVDDLKAQLRGEATRVLELQKKAYDAKMATEAAHQVRNAALLSSSHTCLDVHRVLPYKKLGPVSC